jgi:GxxExxY protein
LNTHEEIYVVNEEIIPYQHDLIYKEEVYAFIACCFEVHKNLGKGFLEAVYVDALCYELNNRSIPFEREKRFEIPYKDIVLPHYYYCDLIIYDRIIIEIKAQENIVNSHYKQLINYLAITNCKLGLLVNFGEDSLKFKRVML